MFGQVFIHKCEKNDARSRGNFRDRPVKLRFGPDQGIDMFDRRRALKQGRYGPADCDQGLAGGVRHQMEMKIIAIHGGLCSPDSFAQPLCEWG